MTEPMRNHTELAALTLQTYRDEYTELSDTWRNLDAKAQGIGALAGVFLAAVFTWARQIPAGLTGIERFLLAVSVVLLAACVFATLNVLLIRSVDAPPFGDETSNMVSHLSGLDPAELPRRLPALYLDQAKTWRDTNCQIRLVNTRKAERLHDAQLALGAAAFTVALLSVVALLS